MESVPTTTPLKVCGKVYSDSIQLHVCQVFFYGCSSYSGFFFFFLHTLVSSSSSGIEQESLPTVSSSVEATRVNKTNSKDMTEYC
jgi:hypothetical protein